MTTNFKLPDAAPPGNVFPSYSQFPMPPAATGVELTTLKADTRQTVVAVTEARHSPAPSSEAPPEVLIPLPPSMPGSRAATAQGEYPPPPPPNAGSRPSTPTRSVPQLTIHTGATPRNPPPDHSHTSSEDTLVRKDSDDSGGPEETPVMRSMFPRLDPDVPLPRQNYVPMTDGMPPPPPRSRQNSTYSPSLYSQPRSPPTMGPHVRHVSLAIAGSSPLRVAEEPPPDLSTGEELLDLWSVANGQGSQEAKETYTLGLEW